MKQRVRTGREAVEYVGESVTTPLIEYASAPPGIAAAEMYWRKINHDD
jgi:hypothetical protein